MLVCVMIEEQITEMESVNICRVNKKCVDAHNVQQSGILHVLFVVEWQHR